MKTFERSQWASFLRTVAAKSGIQSNPEKVVEDIWGEIVKEAANRLTRTGKVDLRGLCTIEVKPYTRKHARTGETIKVKVKRGLKNWILSNRLNSIQ